MDWFCFILIVASMIYAAGIVVDYTNATVDIRPIIVRMQKKTAELVDEAQKEVYKKEAISQRLDDIRATITSLQDRVHEVKMRCQTEVVRQKRLEMVLMKTRLRGNRRLRIAPHSH